MKKCRLLFTALSSCLAILLGLAAWAQADSVSVYEGTSLTDVSLFGNLSQYDTAITAAFGSYGCQVVAYANALSYLERRYPGIYGTALIPNNNLAGTAVNLGGASYLNVQVTRNSQGNITNAFSTLRDLVWGMDLYIEAETPGRTVYGAQMIPPIAGTPGAWTDNRYQPTWVSTNYNYPTEAFLYNALSNSQGLVILWNQVNPSNGQLIQGGKSHLLTITGLTWDSESNRGTLYFIDPVGGTPRNSPFWQAVDGSLWMDYGEDANGTPWQKQAGGNWWFSGYTRITMGMAEGPAPTPLPSSTLLLSSGLLGLIGLRIKRKK